MHTFILFLLLVLMALVLVRSGLKANTAKAEIPDAAPAAEARVAKFRGGEVLLSNYAQQNRSTAFVVFAGVDRPAGTAERQRALVCDQRAWVDEREYLALVASLTAAGAAIAENPERLKEFPFLRTLDDKRPTLSYSGEITGIGFRKGPNGKKFQIHLNNAVSVFGDGLEKALADSGLTCGNKVRIVRFGKAFHIERM